MRAMPTPSTNDRPRFHSDVPVSELTERNTRAIMASVVSLAPLVVEIMDGVTYKTRPTPTKPNGARGLKPPNLRSRDQGAKATHEGPKAASHQIDLGEKT